MYEFINYLISIGFEQGKNDGLGNTRYIRNDITFVFGRRPVLNKKGKYNYYYMLISPTPVLIIGNNPLLGNDPLKAGRIFELPPEEVYQRLVTGKSFYFEK